MFVEPEHRAIIFDHSEQTHADDRERKGEQNE
jgi:hypothetical protein